MTAKKKPRVKPAKVPGLTFEEAMKSLRRGKQIRRRAWHLDSYIFKLGNEVFVRLPLFVAGAPQKWNPYTTDFLANDWEVRRG